ncbi:MAG TPA: TauD/TfdA family dioxygenase [Burkholderiales bacterium]|nr:TauD/TfdA family dioxygenase [Burkholderiales bacterium]
MQVRTAGPIGAEVVDVDVKAIDDAMFSKIYRAWLDFNVVCVRDQALDIPAFLAYSRRFGRVLPHPTKSTRHAEYPEITMLGVNKFRPDGTLDNNIYRRGAEGFHTDGSYEEEPYKATQLYALAVPSRGGDTFFSSGYAAWEELPQRLKDRVIGRYGLFKYGGRKQRNALLEPEDRAVPPVRHPLVRTHPETGRTLLYFDPGKILAIEGYDDEESDALVEDMCAYMTNPPCQYRHTWRKGDIVIWDNRCAYHKAAGDYPPEEDRIHWRVSIKETAAA